VRVFKLHRSAISCSQAEKGAKRVCGGWGNTDRKSAKGGLSPPRIRVEPRRCHGSSVKPTDTAQRPKLHHLNSPQGFLLQGTVRSTRRWATWTCIASPEARRRPSSAKEPRSARVFVQQRAPAAFDRAVLFWQHVRGGRAFSDQFLICTVVRPGKAIPCEHTGNLGAIAQFSLRTTRNRLTSPKEETRA
jgi:hypothetical protein